MGLPAGGDLKTWAWWKKKLLKHFLVLGFLFVIIIALVWPYPGAQVESWEVKGYGIVQTINVCTIFVVSGLTLRTDSAVQSLRHPRGLAYGLVAILIITPMFGFAVKSIGFTEEAFATGLTVFCAVPTTLSSGVALVQAACGNAALALMLTVVSNLVGIVSVPFLLKVMLSNAKLNAVALLLKLLITVLVPLIIGKVAREAIPGAQKWVSNHKTALSLLSNGSLICTVWQTISAAQENIVNTPFGQICLLILAGVMVHVVYLVVNYVLARHAIRIKGADLRAVLIMGSQKTLPVSVTIISYFPASLGAKGLLVVPCIVGHVSQLFIDAVIASRMASREEKRLAAEKVADGSDSGGGNGISERSSEGNEARNGVVHAATNGKDSAHDSSGESPANGKAAAPPIAAEGGAPVSGTSSNSISSAHDRHNGSATAERVSNSPTSTSPAEHHRTHTNEARAHDDTAHHFRHVDMTTIQNEAFEPSAKLDAKQDPHRSRAYACAPPDTDGDIWQTAHTPRALDVALPGDEQVPVSEGSSGGAGRIAAQKTL